MHDQVDGEERHPPRYSASRGNLEDMSLSQLLYAALVGRVRPLELPNSPDEAVEIETLSARPSST